MHIILNNTSLVPIYEQVVEQIKNNIISGELKEQDPLPSVRGLAGTLKISALTVKKAYDKLEEEGFVVTVHGKGTYVASTNQALAMEARRKAVEDDFVKALEKARAVGMTSEEIREMFEFLLEE
ncbi:MAG: GntR family transcriptional regulator [Lachnospiraceae bacterium]|nr:GntR family transcriptional regulator [Lachnospiraceae bacterium]